MSDQADKAMANLAARLCGQPEPFPRRPAPAPLRAVSAENMHEFSSPAKRRGRKPRVPVGGNVVALRPAQPKLLQLPPAPVDSDIDAEVRGIAMFNMVRASRLIETGQASPGVRMTYTEHIAAVWLERGYLPPRA